MQCVGSEVSFKIIDHERKVPAIKVIAPFTQRIQIYLALEHAK